MSKSSENAPNVTSTPEGKLAYEAMLLPSSPKTRKRSSTLDQTVQRLSQYIPDGPKKHPLQQSETVVAETGQTAPVVAPSVQDPKFNILKQWALKLDFSFGDANVEVLLTKIPYMDENIANIFWSYLCDKQRIGTLIRLIKSEIYKKMPLIGDAWDEAIIAAVKTSYKESSEEFKKQERVKLPENAAQFEIDSEELLKLLIKCAQESPDFDIWENGCIECCTSGRGRVLQILYDAGKVKVAHSALLRVAADHAHWHLVGYLMGDSGAMGEQQELMMMYRSLYVIQQGAKYGNWAIVDKVIKSWRMDPNFASKWKIAAEMACIRAQPTLLKKLFEARTPDEEASLNVSLRMMELALASKDLDIVNIVLDLNTNPVDNSILSNLPSDQTLKYTELLVRFCDCGDEEITKQLGRTKTNLDDANILVASLVQHILQSKIVDVKLPAVQNALRNIFNDGNIRVGRVLIDYGIQFDWMEPSMFDSICIYGDAENSSSQASKMEENEYTAIMSGHGITPNETSITFKDFEAILAATVDVQTQQEDEMPDLKAVANSVSNLSLGKVLRAKSEVKMAAPRLLIDPQDSIWNSFLSNMGIEGGIDGLPSDQKSLMEKKASWIEPSYQSPLGGNLDAYTLSEWDKDANSNQKSEEMEIFIALGGIRQEPASPTPPVKKGQTSQPSPRPPVNKSQTSQRNV